MPIPMEAWKYRLSNKTLNAREIVTRWRNPEVGPKKVRRWCEGRAKEVDTFIDAIKVVRILDNVDQ